MREELAALKEMAGPGELGNLTLAAEDARAAWTWLWLERLGQDLRYARRSMFHNKAFTALAVLSLALGIGANTAIYSFMESILLRSLPVPDPQSLVVMKWRAEKDVLDRFQRHGVLYRRVVYRSRAGGRSARSFPTLRSSCSNATPTCCRVPSAISS